MAWVEKRGTKYVGRYKDVNGKYRATERTTTKKAAMALATEEEAKIRKGEWHDPTAGSITFREYFEEHFLPHRTLSVNRRESYESFFRTSYDAAFGDVELRKITAPMVQRWVSAEIKKGTKPRTLADKATALSTILGSTRGVSAMRDGLIAKNPVADLDLPTVPKRKVNIYEVDEYEALIGQLAPFDLIPTLAAESGFRWGELMGLRVLDFSHEFERVTTNRVIIEQRKEVLGTGSRFAWKDSTKSDEDRDIWIVPEVATLVREHVERWDLQPEDRLLNSLDRKHENVRRTNLWPEGLPILRSNFRKKWTRAHHELGIPLRRFHDLRASHITWLLSGGADVLSVQERVGHKNLSTTQKYTAAMRDADKRNLEALNRTRGRHRKGDEE